MTSSGAFELGDNVVVRNISSPHYGMVGLVESQDDDPFDVGCFVTFGDDGTYGWYGCCFDLLHADEVSDDMLADMQQERSIDLSFGEIITDDRDVIEHPLLVVHPCGPLDSCVDGEPECMDDISVGDSFLVGDPDDDTETLAVIALVESRRGESEWFVLRTIVTKRLVMSHIEDMEWFPLS